jgi:DNA-binding NtrC family response regulator
MASENNNTINLLIVDDDKEFLDATAERLGMRDFKVTTATEGALAIKVAKKGNFDVAIVDMKMPGMDGMELLQILKKKHKFLEVIILTGYVSIDSAVEATKLGAYSYMEKPYDFEKLLNTLKEAYETRLKKKFEHDQRRMKEIETLAMGSSPMGILKSLMRLDDDVK